MKREEDIRAVVSLFCADRGHNVGTGASWGLGHRGDWGIVETRASWKLRAQQINRYQSFLPQGIIGLICRCPLGRHKKMTVMFPMHTAV